MVISFQNLLFTVCVEVININRESVSAALKASLTLSTVEKLPLSVRPYGRNTYEKYPAKNSHQHEVSTTT